MFRRASGLGFLMAAAAFVPMVWAAVSTASGTAAPSELSQANLPADGGLVSLDFQDADIRSVLKVLAFKSGVNIVAAPDVTGVVNIELKDVPWQKALDVILSTYGYGFDRKDNIITVMTVENLKKYREDSLALEAQEALVSKTYALNFAKAEDVLKVIDKLISKRGFINFDARTNSVIVRDLERNLELIFGVIKSIDTITPQVMIETKIIETDLNTTENMGIDWVLQVSASGASVPTIFPFNVAKPGQPGQFGATTFYPTLSSTLSGISAPALTSPTTSGFTYGTINASQLSATLNYLSTRENIHVLSDPRIVTLDNQKAKIVVAEQYPEATYSFNSSTGQQQVTGFTTLPIGINFEVTPHVNNAGLVTLELHPQISAFNKTITVNSNQLPDTNNQEAETNVMVEDGKTLVIGGLITDTKTVNKTKFPILGDIPWLGDHFFNSTSTVKSRREIIIFLTPHIITVGKDPASDTTP